MRKTASNPPFRILFSYQPPHPHPLASSPIAQVPDWAAQRNDARRRAALGGAERTRSRSACAARVPRRVACSRETPFFPPSRGAGASSGLRLRPLAPLPTTSSGAGSGGSRVARRGRMAPRSTPPPAVMWRLATSAPTTALRLALLPFGRTHTRRPRSARRAG